MGITNKRGIRFFVTPSQYDKIAKAAKGSGLSIAAFTRMVIMNSARKWKVLDTGGGKFCTHPACHVSANECKHPALHSKTDWIEE